MPPPGARRPAQRIVDSALDAVREALLEANRAERAGQRTPLRRLTRLEYEYTIQDLLLIESMTEGFLVEMPGRYRVTLDIYPYQATSPITLTLFHGRRWESRRTSSGRAAAR